MVEDFWDKLDSLDYIIEQRSVDIEFVDSKSFILRGEIVFINGWRLDFREFSSPDEHDYRFQLMDSGDEMVRRWDSAPHHEVETFPFHVHTPEGVEASEEKEAAEILEIVEDLVVEET